MKYIRISHYIMILTLLIIASACTNEKQLNTNPNEENTNYFEPTREKPEQDEELEHQLGFVRYSEEDLDVMDDDEKEIPQLNREQMADTITKILIQQKPYKEAATLVTDQHVLIAYDVGEENKDSEKLKKIATKTAESIVPGFYDVYVSANPIHMDDIHSLHRETPSNDTDHTIEKIIDNMTKTKEPEKEEI